MAEARTAAKRVPALETRITALDGLKGVLKNRVTTTKRLEKAHKDKRSNDEQLKEKLKEIGEAKRELVKLKAAAADADADLRRLGFDADIAAELNKVRDRATQLRTTRESLAEAQLETDKRVRLAATAEKSAKRKRTEAETASKAHAQSLARLEACQAALREAEEHDRAAHLRAGLRVGEPCPVCEQSVTHLPPMGRGPRLDRLKMAVSEADASERTVRREAKESDNEATNAELAAKHASDGAEETRARSTQPFASSKSWKSLWKTSPASWLLTRTGKSSRRGCYLRLGGLTSCRDST